jgi:hypothetical protein
MRDGEEVNNAGCNRGGGFGVVILASKPHLEGTTWKT